MRDRGLLAFQHIDAFCAYAAERGWTKAEPKGQYEVFRLTHPERPPIIFHARASASVHVTVPQAGVPLVRAFLRRKRGVYVAALGRVARDRVRARDARRDAPRA